MTTSDSPGGQPLATPSELLRTHPLPRPDLVHASRAVVAEILAGRDRRLLLILGPCSIHDPAEALDYAAWVAEACRPYAAQIYPVLRCYVEKSRTGRGWRGLIRQPLTGGQEGACTNAAAVGCDQRPAATGLGLGQARRFLCAVNALGLPIAVEMVSPFLWPYWLDCASWVAVGARGVESQALREAAAALPTACGFKNSLDGSFSTAINAMLSASYGGSCLSIDPAGRLVETMTQGNHLVHLVLRGGLSGSNVDQIPALSQTLRDQGLPDGLIVDASHANAGFRPELQAVQAKAALDWRHRGWPVRGIMLESYIAQGAQTCQSGQALSPGLSVTDPCIGQAETLRILELLAEEEIKRGP